MAVYDRWHKDPDGGQPCKCGKGRRRLYPSAQHGKGARWQVRWRDPDTGKQKKRDFALKEGQDRNLHADAFDREVQGSIVRNDYADPSAGNVTLHDYAEQRRKARSHGESAATGLESRLRCHVYEGEPGSGLTPTGAPSIGQHAMGLLARRPSLVAAWFAAVPLADSSRLLVLGDVSAAFQAAIEDGVVGRDPTKSKAVDRPRRQPSKALPFSPAEVAGVAAAMQARGRGGDAGARFGVVPWLGTGTGMREMEMAGLGADDIVRGKRPKVRVARQLKVIGGELRFGPLKNRKAHDVPVPPGLLERVDAHMREFPPLTVTLPWHEPGSKLHGAPHTVRLLLSRPDGTPVTRNAMDGMWRGAVIRWRAPGVKGRRLRRLAVRGYGIHRLRHTFASTQLRAGVDVVRVAAWMGDTVEVVTKTYAHLMPDDHDGEQAGRAASAAFLASCALSVPPAGDDGAPGQLRAV